MKYVESIYSFDEKYISRNRNDNVMNGALIVQPNQKRMSGALFLIHGGGYVVGNYKDNLGIQELFNTFIFIQLKINYSVVFFHGIH